MNEIHILDLSKRYYLQWVIRNLNYCFVGGHTFGVSGRNGSGKSTLMQILSGYLSPSAGTIKYFSEHAQIPNDKIYTKVSLVGPYTDLINEFSLIEMFHFHFRFKPLIQELTFTEFEDIIQLNKQSHKPLSQFSSGMKQKIQLALALLSDTSFLLFDEPTSFLDVNAKKWFSEMLEKYTSDRLTIISSNDSYDLNHCSDIITLQ